MKWHINGNIVVISSIRRYCNCAFSDYVYSILYNCVLFEFCVNVHFYLILHHYFIDKLYVF